MPWPKKSNKQPARQPRLMPGQEDYAFRRSRTITGSTSARVAPSAENRSQLKTPRLKAHELYQQRSRILRLLLVLSGGIILLVFLVANYISAVPVRYVQHNNEADTATYQAAIDAYFGQNPLQRFGFLLNATQLQAFVQSQRSEVDSLRVDTEWYGGNPHFVVQFRQPVLVWQTAGQQFYVDAKGIAFDYDHFKQPLVAVDDESGISPDSGSSVASQRFLRFLGKLVGAVNSSGKGEVEAIIIPPSTRQIDLRLKGRGYAIKTHIDRDPLQQAEDIANALKYFDEKAITPEYVDVRVVGKAFYK